MFECLAELTTDCSRAKALRELKEEEEEDDEVEADEDFNLELEPEEGGLGLSLLDTRVSERWRRGILKSNTSFQLDS